MLSFFKQHPLSVIKLGGSLFSIKELGEKLSQLLTSCDLPNPVVIAGGGAFADAVREFDRVHQLPRDLSHNLGVRSMSLSARFVAGLNPALRYSANESTVVETWKEKCVPVLDVAETVLQAAELPASWDVTSDSVAAWIASQHGDSKLVLLKSVDLPNPSISVVDAVERKLVDSYFPIVSRDVAQILWCNVRRNSLQVVQWK